MAEALLLLPSLAAVLSHVEIGSTADLTRALKSNSLTLQQRLALAWAIFDSSNAGEKGGVVRRLSAILVRKNELLADWLFSTMVRELKTAKPDQYALHRDIAAIKLLICILEAINSDMSGSGSLVEVRTVFQKPVMPLFMAALERQLASSDTEYIAAMTSLWQFIAQSTSDGAEMLSEQPDQLARLLGSLAANYLAVGGDEPDKALGESLSHAVSSVASVARTACETTHNAPKLFTLFAKELLLPLLRIASLAPQAATRSSVLDLLHVCLFHPDCMNEFATVLQERSGTAQYEPSQKYINQFFDITTSALKAQDRDTVAQYSSALPDLFARYLQSSTLICPATRSHATSTLGLSALTANPLNVAQAAVSNSCFQMFTYLYGLLLPKCAADERVLGAINRLVKEYFTDPCFGTTNNASIVSSDIYQSQIESLNSWLSTVIGPVLASKTASTESVVLALGGIDLALDAAPDSVQDHSAVLLDAFSHVARAAQEPATQVLTHLIATLKKARQLDSMVAKLTKVQFAAIVPDSGNANLLVSALFIRELNAAVSQSMPFAQTSSCLAALVDAIVAEAAATEEGSASSKRRRLSRQHHASASLHTDTYRVNVLATLAANFVLSSASAVNTEHQRILYRKALSQSYESLLSALSAESFAWERLLLHYTFMEVASRIDGTERWMEACMHPERVQQAVLPSGLASKKPSNAVSPRTQAISMLVAFQTAAHWSVFVSSLSAGIIPESAAGSADSDRVTRAVEKMVSDACTGLHACMAHEHEGVPGSEGGWGPWDGHAHSICDANCNTAQWRLLTDWLELVCECASTDVVESIASRIVAEIAAPSAGSHRYSLCMLESASFFEMGKIREAFLPGLTRFAAATWRAQVGTGKRSSPSPSSKKLPQRIAHALERLADGVSGSKGPSKSHSAQSTISDIIAALELAGSKQKTLLAADQAATWIQLLRSLLRFPTAYWTADGAHTVFALALLVDSGMASMCESQDDAVCMRILCRELLERLVKSLPNLSVHLVQHAGAVVDLWIATAGASASLVRHSRRLLYLTMGALAQSAFGQEVKAADAACRKLAEHLYNKICGHASADSLVSALALEAFSSICKVAKQYSKKVQQSSVIKPKKWMSLIAPWAEHVSVVVANAAKCSDLNGALTDEQATCSLGILIALESLKVSFAAVGGGETSSSSSSSAQLAKQTIGSVKELSRSSSSFALGLVLHAIHQASELDSGATGLLAFLAHRLSLASTNGSVQDRICPSLQSLVALAADIESEVTENKPLADVIAHHAIEPLLRKVGASTFEQTFVAFLKLAAQPCRFNVPSINRVVAAYVRVAYRHDGKMAVEKRKAVQRRLGCILTTVHSAMTATSKPADLEAVTSALTMVNDLVLEPFMRFTVFDVSESLSIVSSAVSLSLALERTGSAENAAQQLSALYKLVCKTLSGIVRHHTNDALDAISLLVDVMRLLVHAFVAPAIPRVSGETGAVGVSAASTPWIVAYAPFPAECAEAYARVISELVRARRFTASPSAAGDKREKKGARAAAGDEEEGAFVKLTRGTNAAGAASVLSLFAPYILAEYCVIQGGGKLSTGFSRPAQPSEPASGYRFQGLCWQPVPVLSAASAAGLPTRSDGGIRGIISSPALREALLPGWHALLDVMAGSNRNSLLTLLAGSSSDTMRHAFGGPGWVSIFGPGRYGGANEVLKSLYQSYLSFYKYKGQV
ncbi:hypothetical protein GQ54DRAFT_294718 [Martensiomyces pterosporus]|nr:hypothetical protein GQ54DRAFT_294718 [Martensiomyces pterosporus]